MVQIWNEQNFLKLWLFTSNTSSMLHKKYAHDNYLYRESFSRALASSHKAYGESVANMQQTEEKITSTAGVSYTQLIHLQGFVFEIHVYIQCAADISLSIFS